MAERVFVDTNIWVYAIDRSEPAKRERARAALAPRQDAQVTISSQVLTEFYTVVTRKLASPLSAEQAAQMVDHLAQLPVVSVDADLVLRAISGSRSWGISLWDALIIGAAEAAGCDVVLSEDLADGATYGSVRVANPLA
ncbi:MAG: PIN domain-containing protein [Candidatus Limnocylindrales bacterium]